MRCQKCGMNEANVTIKQNINGNESIYYLCAKCANDEKLINVNFNFDNMLTSMFSDFNNIIEDMFNTRTNILIGPKQNAKEKYTQKHKLNSYSFNKTNKVDIKDINEDINSLEIQLKEAVNKEDYENAAIIRDKIKLLKNKDK